MSCFNYNYQTSDFQWFYEGFIRPVFQIKKDCRRYDMKIIIFPATYVIIMATYVYEH